MRDRTISTIATDTAPEPTAAELDAIVQHLKDTWTARVTVRRQSRADAGIKSIYVSLDGDRIAKLGARQEVSVEVPPGPHRLRVHNTLFWKTIDFTVAVGEHASFVTVNRECPLTYSVMAYVLGTNVVYLTLDREPFYGSLR